MEMEEHDPGRIGRCCDGNCSCWLSGIMVICGQLRSCELKFGLVVNLWLVEQIVSKEEKIKIAKLVVSYQNISG